MPQVKFLVAGPGVVLFTMHEWGRLKVKRDILGVKQSHKSNAESTEDNSVWVYVLLEHFGGGPGGYGVYKLYDLSCASVFCQQSHKVKRKGPLCYNSS